MLFPDDAAHTYRECGVRSPHVRFARHVQLPPLLRRRARLATSARGCRRWPRPGWCSRSPAAAPRSARRSRSGSCPCCCSACGAARSPTASTGASVLLVTQTAAALLAVVLWLIVLTGVVQVWMVFALAVALGLVTVVDEPARHAFVEEMVGPRARCRTRSRSTARCGTRRASPGPALAGVLDRDGRHVVGVLRQRGVVLRGRRRAARDARRPSSHRPHAARRHGRACARGSRTRGASREIRSTIVLVAVVGTLVYNFPTFLTLHGERHVRRRRRARRAS